MTKCSAELRIQSSVYLLILFFISLNAFVVPFLPVQNDFHPKRNQARQKLATLPVPRFQDLAFDVYTELERRSPQLISIYVAKYGDRDGTYPANDDLAPSQSYKSSSNASPILVTPTQIDKKSSVKSDNKIDNLMADLGNFSVHVSFTRGLLVI